MRRGAGRQLIAAAAGAGLLACASAGRPVLLGPPREQPAPLIGRWAAVPDSAHEARAGGASAAAPRRAWLVLRADGAQWTEHATDSPGATAPQRDSPRAWWWVHREANGEDRLCLHWRAGRHRADCAPFQLDTIQQSGRAVPRLRWSGAEWVAAP